MITATTKKQVRDCVKEWKNQGFSVGFVPTMGYLHEGHLSLIENSIKNNDKTVVSIFVNPMQFSPNEDLESYPRDFKRDSRLCETAGVDLIFHPEAEEMYGSGFCTFVDMGVLTEELCGLTRPIHFRGVCTVVSKLFNIVRPNNAYFGQKDAQQLAVIKRMAADLDMDINIVGCPIIREADGLAKSSRNTYLNKDERKAALILSRAIKLGLSQMQKGERESGKIIKAMKELIESEPLAKIDYVKIVDTMTMQHLEIIDRPVLCAIAVYIGKTRLIDNFSYET